MADEEVEIIIEASSEKFDSEHPGWRAQVGDLHQALHGKAGVIRKRVHDQPGKKGGVEEIILALGTSGALTIALGAFQAWLKKDGTRILELTVKRGERVESLKVKAEGMSQDKLAAFAAAVWSGRDVRDG